MEMKCVKDYKGIGYHSENPEKNAKVSIKVGDIIECDKYGYLWKKKVCFGHKDANPGSYFEFV